MSRAVLLCLFASSVAMSLPAQDVVMKAKPQEPKFQKTDGYPLDVCIVNGKELKKDAFTVEIDGRVFKTCCAKCPTKIKADPETYNKKYDEAVIKAQSATYPSSKCPVSGKDLGSMGEPVQVVLGSTLVKLCCKGCTKKAEANQQEIVAQLQAAAFEAQDKSYATKVCPVMEEAFDPKYVINVMHGTKLVKLCCDDCLEVMQVTPNKFAALIPVAAKPKAEDAAGHGKQGGKEHEKDEKKEHDKEQGRKDRS